MCHMIRQKWNSAWSRLRCAAQPILVFSILALAVLTVIFSVFITLNGLRYHLFYSNVLLNGSVLLIFALLLYAAVFAYFEGLMISDYHGYARTTKYRSVILFLICLLLLGTVFPLTQLCFSDLLLTIYLILFALLQIVAFCLNRCITLFGASLQAVSYAFLLLYALIATGLN